MFADSLGAAPPHPTDPSEAARVDHTRLRRRLLTGTWEQDLEQRMLQNLGSVRRQAIGAPDLSANPFEAMVSGAAALYDRPARVRHADAFGLELMRQFVAGAQLWPLLARVQVDVLGLREELVEVRAVREIGGARPVYTPVPPDLARLVPHPDDASRPMEVRHAVRRHDPRDPDKTVWTWDLWRVGNDAPVHRVLASDGRHDVSAAYGLPEGGLVGPDYPFLRQDGRPVLPFALYHASRTGYLLDPFHKAELVQGTLNVGVLWTFFTHCVRAASWPQRWISGGFLGGASDEAGVRRVVADPATILEILRDPDFEGQVTAGQWGSASDPKAVAEAIAVYEARFAGYAGLDPSDLQRVSGDPRSGIALAVSTAGRRAAQRRYSPIFAPVDVQLLELTAVAMNRTVGSPVLPEDGWQVDHVALPPSIEERRAEREEVLELLRQGIYTKAEARARLVDEDVETAAATLAAAAAADGAGGDAALAGAQTQALVQVVASVARGELTARGAVAILRRSYGLDEPEALAMVDGAESLAALARAAPVTPRP